MTFLPVFQADYAGTQADAATGQACLDWQIAADELITTEFTVGFLHFLFHSVRCVGIACVLLADCVSCTNLCVTADAVPGPEHCGDPGGSGVGGVVLYVIHACTNVCVTADAVSKPDGKSLSQSGGL